MSDQGPAHKIIHRLQGPEIAKGRPAGAKIEVRRARRGDVPAIVAVVHKAAQRLVEEAEVLDWLFGKGLLVAVQDNQIVGVAAWQAENLVSVTDLFHVYPAKLRSPAGSRLLSTIESEANVLMCEANVIVLPSHTSRAMRAFLRQQGYEPRAFQELHRIWREVLGEFVGSQPDLMVKRLREKMVMAPI
jgi:N-acetylglutamate synthase-like GNAT family acetyltransferase